MIIRGPVCIKPHKCNLKSEGPSGPAFLNLPSGDGSPQPMYSFRHAFLMKLRRLEAEQGEVEIEQASQSERGNHRTDSNTPA